MRRIKYLGSKESMRELYESREALDLYLKKLKELMEPNNTNMQVKAKFRCESIVDSNHGNDFVTRRANFRAVYGKEGENADYSKATPSGELSIVIDKSTLAYDAFQPGKNYYLTFDEAPE